MRFYRIKTAVGIEWGRYFKLFQDRKTLAWERVPETGWAYQYDLQLFNWLPKDLRFLGWDEDVAMFGYRSFGFWYFNVGWNF